jgi:hypothetical protein
MIVLYIYLLVSVILLFSIFKLVREVQELDRDNKIMFTKEENLVGGLVIGAFLSLMWPVLLLVNPVRIMKSFMYGIGYVDGFIARKFKGG